jgi:TonB family protein
LVQQLPRYVRRCVIRVFKNAMTSSDKRAAGESDPNILSHGLFKTLDFTESRKGFFGTSVAAHAALLCILLVIPLVYTDTIKVKFDVVLIAPRLPKKEIVEPVHFQRVPSQEPVIQRKVLPAPPPPKPILVEPPEVRPSEVPQIARLKQPEISQPDQPALRLAEAPVPAPKMPEVRTGTFATESALRQTAGLSVQTVQAAGFGDPVGSKKADHSAQAVQAAGFGDPVGSKGATRSPRIANIASPGSFDLADAANARNGRNLERVVHQSGFGDVDVSAKPERPKKRAEIEAATPVEILFKPKPDYSDKARTAKVEGEVLLRVLFSAMGDVRVLDIVRGLGYGLDENAVRAAQQIKFRPAQSDGQPVDSTATVHIVFQLAY